MTRHAILPPSGAPRWGNCAGSVPLEQQCPEDTLSPEAMEGNAAHWMAATILTDMRQFKQARQIPPGTTAPNGVVVTDEMADAVEMFVDDVLEGVGSDALDTLHIEEWVDIAAVHPDNGGTPDVWWAAVNPGLGAYLHIRDYKHGHKFVDAFENLQLIDYCAGILGLPMFAGIPFEKIEIELGIVQPRNFHPLGPVRRWKTTAWALTPYVNKLREAAHEARGNATRTVVGPWCRDCLARRLCPALQTAADSAMDLAGSAGAAELPPSALGVELRMMERAAKLLEARLAGLQEQAESLIKKGVAVPFYEIQQTTGREAWRVPPQEIFALGEVMGVDLRQPRPVTPAQARKAGVPEDLVSTYAIRPAGALKLTQVNTLQARKVFSK